MRLGVVISALLLALALPSRLLLAQHFGHHAHLAINLGFIGGYGAPFYGPRYPVVPPYGYGNGYTVNGLGPFYLPPVVIGPMGLFGPAPFQNFVGNGNVNFNGNGNAVGAVAPPPVVPPIQRPPRKPRVANAEARARAGKFLDAGDRLFHQQRYREALERYRLATPQAPDMAENFMRQGFAEVAIGNFETASRLLRRGLKIQPNWRPGELRLDDLYVDTQAAKAAHFEALAQKLQAAPHDANLHFVLGLMLEFDGQPQRATPFLIRADQLGANSDHVLDGFLPVAANPANLAPAKGPIL